MRIVNSKKIMINDMIITFQYMKELVFIVYEIEAYF